MGRRSHRVVIIVQNLPVPLDRRVWLECQALVTAGFDVSVVCPKGPGDPGFEVREGVRLHKYRPAPGGSGGLSGYVVEFAWSWVATAARVLSLRLRRGIDVLQACNPPDTYGVLARPLTWTGVRFVYDQHDLNPEVFLSRFGAPQTVAGRAQLRLLYALERFTYRTADHVIVTNDSYREVALRRGGLDPDQVTVVRSGPDTAAMRPVEVDPALRRGRRHLVVYLGIMGPQDGVDLLLQAVDVLVHELGRDDVHVALLGFGDCLQDLRRQAVELGVDEHVTFTGRADARMVCEYLSTADLGVCPDPSSPLNDVSTMNKVMEYMAYALPVVAFDLRENRLSVGEAGVLVPPGDVEGFARAMAGTLDDTTGRTELAEAARQRAVQVLDWAEQRRRYVGVYDRLVGSDGSLDEPAPPERRHDEAWAGVDVWGHRVVDLREPGELRRQLLSRSPAEPPLRRTRPPQVVSPDR